jgi:hypothetical protein
VNVLQTYFIKKTTIKQFEKTLGDFTKYTYNGFRDIIMSDTMFYTDGTYKITTKYYVDRDRVTRAANLLWDEGMYIEYGKDSIITAMRFSLMDKKLSDDKIGDFINQLLKAGFEIDKEYNRLNRIIFQGYNTKVYMKNKVKRIYLSIYFKDELESWVTIGSKVN